MQCLARSAVAPAVRQSFRRSFASSAARAQAVPTEKPVVMKEFKIYRWVSSPPIIPEASGVCVGGCDEGGTLGCFASVGENQV